MPLKYPATSKTLLEKISSGDEHPATIFQAAAEAI